MSNEVDNTDKIMLGLIIFMIMALFTAFGAIAGLFIGSNKDDEAYNDPDNIRPQDSNYAGKYTGYGAAITFSTQVVLLLMVVGTFRLVQSKCKNTSTDAAPKTDKTQLLEKDTPNKRSCSPLNGLRWLLGMHPKPATPSDHTAGSNPNLRL